MRINVYSQELTGEAKIVTQVAKDTGLTYHGVRMFLASPNLLHNSPNDDDRSAITLWIPHARSFNKASLAMLLTFMADLVRKCPDYSGAEVASGATE